MSYLFSITVICNYKHNRWASLYESTLNRKDTMIPFFLKRIESMREEEKKKKLNTVNKNMLHFTFPRQNPCFAGPSESLGSADRSSACHPGYWVGKIHTGHGHAPKQSAQMFAFSCTNVTTHTHPVQVQEGWEAFCLFGVLIDVVKGLKDFFVLCYIQSNAMYAHRFILRFKGNPFQSSVGY